MLTEQGKTLLLQVADLLPRIPNHFIMSIWFDSYGECFINSEGLITFPETNEQSFCGTIGCMAGWVVALKENEEHVGPIKVDSYKEITEEAGYDGNPGSLDVEDRAYFYLTGTTEYTETMEELRTLFHTDPVLGGYPVSPACFPPDITARPGTVEYAEAAARKIREFVESETANN